MALMQIGHIKRALVLCPAPLITVWYNEVKTVLGGFVKLKGEFDVVEYSARTAKERDYSLRQTRRKDKPLLVIASRDLVGGNVPRSKNPLFPTGKDTGLTWDWLIVDEAHSRARNPKTVLGDALRNKSSKLTKGSFVLLLTATPISNNIEVRKRAAGKVCFPLCYIGTSVCLILCCYRNSVICWVLCPVGQNNSKNF